MILIAISLLIGYIARAARIQEPKYRRNKTHPRPTKKGFAARWATDGLGTIDAFDEVVFEIEPPP